MTDTASVEVREDPLPELVHLAARDVDGEREVDGFVLVDPTTGDVVSIDDATSDVLAAYVDRMQEFGRLVAEAVREGRIELTRRADRSGAWTAHLPHPRGGVLEIKAASPTAGATKWDKDKLREGLCALVPEVLTQEAVDAAVELVEPPPPEPFLQVKDGGIKALSALGDDAVTAAIAAARTVTPKAAGERPAAVKRRTPKAAR